MDQSYLVDRSQFNVVNDEINVKYMHMLRKLYVTHGLCARPIVSRSLY